jgi:histidinol phosphatase-like PHP family hydrolase
VADLGPDAYRRVPRLGRLGGPAEFGNLEACATDRARWGDQGDTTSYQASVPSSVRHTSSSKLALAQETLPGPLPNTVIGELLCLAADEPDRSYQQRRALRRAGRAAFRWPVEVSELIAEGHSLTELRFIGPWLAHLIEQWLLNPPAVPIPPAIRKDFLSRPDVERILKSKPSARKVRGDLQTHTSASDGTASVREMAQAAIERGLEYLAITDHSKGLAIANGMDEAHLALQGEEIQRLNAELIGKGFRILRGVEMNLSPGGEGDLDPNFLPGIDVVVGAFHSRLRLTEDQTDRYLAALSNSNIHILAHPRGRIFNFRVGLQADWSRVFRCAREHNRAIEIDGYPDRQDLDVELLKIARETGTIISLGSDAHAPDQLSFLDFSIAAARHVGIPESRILNCKTADELLGWTAESRP